MNIQFLSNRYIIRDLLPQDAEMVYEALKNNTIFYQYHPPFVTKQSIAADMESLPPGKSRDDKYYVGFFENNALVANMDLILDYPTEEIAWIGLLMTKTVAKEDAENEGK